MDNINVTDEENITVVNNASEIRTMSKRQLKKVKKKEKWLERKAEKRLGMFVDVTRFSRS